jgi:hypothetical protein
MSLFEHEVEKVELLREIRDSLRVLVEDRGTPTKKLFTKAEVRARLGISNDILRGGSGLPGERHGSTGEMADFRGPGRLRNSWRR